MLSESIIAQEVAAGLDEFAIGMKYPSEPLTGFIDLYLNAKAKFDTLQRMRSDEDFRAARNAEAESKSKAKAATK